MWFLIVSIPDLCTLTYFNDIARNGTLVLYKEFKQYFEYEKYLTELPSKLRIPLAKLRLSSRSAAHRNWALLTK